MALDTTKLSGQEIDDILDEIEDKDPPPIVQSSDNPSGDANWQEILTQIRAGNVHYIKNLVSSNDIQINTRNPQNGMTLLIYAVILGNVDLVKAICNFGGDPHIKDANNLDALDYARRYGMYRITELLYYQQLSGSLGKDLKDIASLIHQKTKEASLITKQLKTEMIKFMENAIKNRLEFSADLLYYTVYWNNTDIQTGYAAKTPLNKPLWKQMMKTFNEILCNTKDKNGWEWLKKSFIPSLIWYLPHPENKPKNEDGGSKMTRVLEQTLFNELLIRVRKESKHQSDLLLKDKINEIKKEKASDWDDLLAYNVTTEWSKNARQDVCKCLVPRYSKDDLNEKRYPPTTTFSAQKHYDKNIYLNELLFTANVLNRTFQMDMKRITRKIAAESNGTINAVYRAGPIKTLQRSQTKVENDYINEDYPTSAKILDINRCALQFDTIGEMMKFIEIFTKTIEEGNANSIDSIIRCKNGWSVYNPEYPQYTDVKLNVLCKTKEGSVIAEIQFLLDLMSSFKKVAHKLYGIERKFEMVYNFGVLQQKMADFDDNVNSVKNLSDNDDIEYFKTYLDVVNHDNNALIGFKMGDEHNAQLKDSGRLCSVWSSGLVNIIVNDGKINHYLKAQQPDLYYNSIRYYLSAFTKETHIGDPFRPNSRTKNEFSYFVQLLTNKFKINGSAKQDEICCKLLKGIFDSAQNDQEKLMQIFNYKDRKGVNGQTLFMEIKTKRAFEMILNNPLVTDKDKTNMIYNRSMSTRLNMRTNCAITVLPMIKFMKNDARALSKVLLNTQLLHYICRWGEFLSTQSLRLIFNHPTLSSQVKVQTLTKNDGWHYTPFDLLMDLKTRDGYNHERHAEGHTMVPILRGLTKDEFVEVLKYHFAKGSNATYRSLERYRNPLAVLSILKHLCKDRERFMWLLTQKYGDNGKRFFDRLCEDNSCPELMRCVLSESVLTKEDVKELLFGNVVDTTDTKMFKFYVLAEKKNAWDKEKNKKLNSMALPPSAMEIIKYLKDDKDTLLQLLTYNVYRKVTFFMWLCSDESGMYGHNHQALEFIFTKTVLSVQDVFELFYKYQDEEKKNALYYALDIENDSEYPMPSYNPLQIIHYFAGHPDLLKQLVMQPSMHSKPLIMLFKYEKHLEDLLIAIGDNQWIVDNIDGIQFANSSGERGCNLESERDDAVKKSKTLIKWQQAMSEQKEFDLLSKEYSSHQPILTAINRKQYQIIETFILKHVGSNVEKYIRTLAAMKTYGTGLIHYFMADMRLLTLFLENTHIPDDIKCKLLCMHKETEDKTIGGLDVDMSYFPDAAFVYDGAGEDKASAQLEVLKYFANKKDVESLKALASIPYQGNYNAIGTIANVEALKVILYESGLDQKFLIGQLNPLLLGDEPFIEQTGFVIELCRWLKDDRDALLELFGGKLDDERTPFSFIATHESPGVSFEFLLNKSALTDEDKKRMLLFNTERGTNIFYSACDVYESRQSGLENAIAIWDYFEAKQDYQTLKEMIFAFMTRDNISCVHKVAEQKNGGAMLKRILIFVDKHLSTEEQLKLLLMKDKEIYGLSNFMWKIKNHKDLQMVFQCMNNNEVVKQLVEQIGGYHKIKTLYEYFRHHGDKGSEMDDRYKGEQLVAEWMDYDKLVQVLKEKGQRLDDVLFDEYDTNPFITACYLGKGSDIMSLIEKVDTMDKNQYKLQALLVGNYNWDNGNNCLLELVENGFDKIMIGILDFLEKQKYQNIKERVLSYQNKMTKATILMQLSQNDDYLDAIHKILEGVSKAIVSKLLNQKDNQNKTCLDYATPNIRKAITKYTA